MQSTLFDTVLGGESMFSPSGDFHASATATNTNATLPAKELALETQDEFLGGLEASVTPVDQNSATNDNDTGNDTGNGTGPGTGPGHATGHADSNSSATTKLNTANNSFLDLQQLNGPDATNTSTNTNTKNTSLLSQNTMYNLESLSTSSAMNDLLAMLDQEEDVQNSSASAGLSHSISPRGKGYDSSNEIKSLPRPQQQQHMRQTSNSFIDSDMDPFAPQLDDTGNEHLLPDIAEDSAAMQRKNSYVDQASSAFGAALMAANPSAMHSGMPWARRASELVSTQTAQGPRQSISDSVDFWNLGAQQPGTTSPLSQHRHSINEELSQALSGYNMNFEGEGSSNNVDVFANNDDNDNDDEDVQMGLNSPRQSISVDFSLSSPRARTQHSGTAAAAPPPPGNELFYNLYNQNDQLNLDYYNLSMSSDEPAVPVPGPTQAPVPVPLPADDLASPRKKFIKPSMMLADSASLTAKLAFSGLQKKQETFPTIDTQSFHHPTKIVKRKSVSSTTPVNSRADQSRRRRKSTIGISTMSSFSTSPRNSMDGTTTASEFPGASAKRNSNSSIQVALLEDSSAKPFQCKDCDKAFRRSEHLKRHVRSVHSTDRPFPCMLCEKKFSRSDNLSQHLKTHKKHGDF